MKFFSLISVLCSLLLVGCQKSTPAPEPLGKDDSGKTISLNVGDTITVKLEGNPTTGYEWLSSPESNASDAGELDINYLSDPNPGGATGVGGTYFVTFTAIQEGEVSIILEHRRKWEEKPPLETFKLHLKVSPQETEAPQQG